MEMKFSLHLSVAQIAYNVSQVMYKINIHKANIF